jgi:hypothetical protein
VSLTQCANPLHILEGPRLGPRDLVAVEVELCHAAEQQIGGMGTTTRKLVELSDRDTDVLRDALEIILPAASELGSRGALPHPVTPPARNRLKEISINLPGGH